MFELFLKRFLVEYQTLPLLLYQKKLFCTVYKDFFFFFFFYHNVYLLQHSVLKKTASEYQSLASCFGESFSLFLCFSDRFGSCPFPDFVVTFIFCYFNYQITRKNCERYKQILLQFWKKYLVKFFKNLFIKVSRVIRIISFFRETSPTLVKTRNEI